MRKIFFLCFAVVGLGACQDHHFVPIEKADSIKLPSAQTGAEQPGKAMESLLAKQYQKGKEPGGYAGPPQIMVEGNIDLGAALKKRDFTGYTLYVIAWPKDGKGPPIAATRVNSPKFPIRFKLDSGDVMMNEPPAPGSEINVEARLDKDSDPSVKSAGDVAGATNGTVPVGSTDVKITIDRDR
jgi:hypothetical protein